MAVVTNNGRVVGTLLLDPEGTNMGIDYDPKIDHQFWSESQRKFLKKYPTGTKIENKDIDLSDVKLDD